MDADVRESPELRRWREEALPPIVTAALDAIRQDPGHRAIHRLVNDAVKQALSNLIVLLERQPTDDDFVLFAASFVSAVNDALPEISDYVAVVVGFPKDGSCSIGAVEKRLIRTGKPLKKVIIFLDLPNAGRDDRNELMIEPD